MSVFTSFYRSLMRHRLFAALNIGGLALGIAVFLVLFLFVRFETGYDRILPGWARVWKVERTLQFPGNPEVPIPSAPALLGQLKAAFPNLEGARMAPYDNAAVLTGRSSATGKLALVDANYFRIFPFPLIEGDIATTLARPDGIVLTRKVAETYFGTVSALGRTLTIALDGKAKSYRVGAVIADLPKNMTYPSEMFAALPTDIGVNALASSYGVTTFLALPDAATAERVSTFIRHHPDPEFNSAAVKALKTWVTPLASVHLADARTRIVVTVLGIVGIIALLLAIVNYINLATARAGLRAREIAMRKVVGATRRALIAQLLGEAFVAVTLAALIGLALAEVALPFVNAVGGTDLGIVYWGAGSILPPLGLLIAVVTVFAGFHPAFIISRFQPAGVLAAARSPGGDRAGVQLRKVLVVIQFGIAIALMIGTAVLVAQSRHVQDADLGFRRDNLIMASAFNDPALDPAQRVALVSAIRQIPGVVATTISGVAPGGGSFAIGPMHRAGAIGEAPMIVQATIGERFFETYGAQMLAGRLFDPGRFALDDSSAEARGRVGNVILNRTAIQRLGFARPADAVDQVVSQDDGSVMIIGVVADMRFGTPRQPVEALVYGYRSKISHPVLTVRTASTAPHVLARIEAIWRRVAPTVPFAVTTVDQTLYESFYRQDAQRSRLFTIGALLAVLIGCIGLYGLASFDTARRIREIGIRKVLGASTADVLRLLVGQFLKPVIVANLIAWPIAFFAMRRWLAGFDDRVALSPWFFVGASAVALGIATLTVVGHAWRVARAEPARALRHE